VQFTIDRSSQWWLQVTDKENEKIKLPFKVMSKKEVMNDLLILLGLVQKHADKNRCQYCLDLLESVFEH
jgi:hypothetical protein